MTPQQQPPRFGDFDEIQSEGTHGNDAVTFTRVTGAVVGMKDCGVGVGENDDLSYEPVHIQYEYVSEDVSMGTLESQQPADRPMVSCLRRPSPHGHSSHESTTQTERDAGWWASVCCGGAHCQSANMYVP